MNYGISAKLPKSCEIRAAHCEGIVAIYGKYRKVRKSVDLSRRTGKNSVSLEHMLGNLGLLN
jgi:hypothetical protein